MGKMNIICPDCNGAGGWEDWDGTFKRCGMCHGHGVKILDNKEKQP